MSVISNHGHPPLAAAQHAGGSSGRGAIFASFTTKSTTDTTKNGVVGRKQGYTKSDDKMKQQYSQEIKLLRKGLSLREVSKLTGHSVNTIRKVSHFV